MQLKMRTEESELKIQGLEAENQALKWKLSKNASSCSMRWKKTCTEGRSHWLQGREWSSIGKGIMLLCIFAFNQGSSVLSSMYEASLRVSGSNSSWISANFSGFIYHSLGIPKYTPLNSCATMKTNALMVFASAGTRSYCHGNSGEGWSASRCEQQPICIAWGLLNIILNNEYLLLKNEHLPHVIYY